MFVEFGHFSVVLAMMLSLVQTSIGFLGARKGWINWINATNVTAALQFVLTFTGFCFLVFSFANSDFSVKLVAMHSHTLKPLLYKLSGTWGNHEGSMLLWVLILTFYGFLVSRFGSNLPVKFRGYVLAVQGLISFFFFVFLIFTSNPFTREPFPPINGNGLNPVLQDPGLAFHPPFLYLGYVGLSIPFSFAVAALIEGRMEPSWARWVRPWTLISWVSLTLGISLGSYWAYYELGWGGWWFWDPVENASFMPWLAATALLHSVSVVEKRNTLKSWTILLAILAFSLSLIGTFIVRSGIITSVHAFANDPARGIYLLFIVFLTVAGTLALYATRFAKIRSLSQFSILSRESAIISNNLLFSMAIFVVFVGTFWPLVAEVITSEKISVGAPFFNLVFAPIVIMLSCLLPVGAALQWKRGKITKSIPFMWGAITLSLGLSLSFWAVESAGALIAPIGIFLATWVIAGAILEFTKKLRLKHLKFLQILRRLYFLSWADHGKLLGHLGFGLIIFGVCSVSAWEIEDIRVVKIDETYNVGNYQFQLRGVEQLKTSNFYSQKATITARLEDGKPITLYPEKRFYPIQSISTTEASIDTTFTRDLYTVLGDKKTSESWVVKTYVKPFVVWIWIGALTIATGGLLSAADRRARVAVTYKKFNKELRDT